MADWSHIPETLEADAGFLKKFRRELKHSRMSFENMKKMNSCGWIACNLAFRVDDRRVQSVAKRDTESLVPFLNPLITKQSEVRRHPLGDVTNLRNI